MQKVELRNVENDKAKLMFVRDNLVNVAYDRKIERQYTILNQFDELIG